MRYTRLFTVEAMCSQPFGCSKYAMGEGRGRYRKDSQGNPYHEGGDYWPKGKTDWRLFAFRPGTIMWAGWGDTYGWNIMLWDKESRMSYRFCHLDSMDVAAGDTVRIGDKLGVAGNSGKSAGPHLHLNAVPMAVWGEKLCDWNDRGGRVDPLGLLVSAGVHI